MAQRVLRLGRAKHIPGYLKKVFPGLFLQELLAQPGIIGAVCPSSPFLAQCMARQVGHPSDGLIIELGPGTGVVTKALLKQGVAPERLLLVEYSARFVHRLRKRFAQVKVIHGNAADLCRMVPEDVKVSAIVSSLPLCSLPEPLMQSIVQQWQYLLHDSGIVVQFTYNLHKPKWQRHVQATQTGSSIVWANLPPARVATFSFHTAKLSSPHEHPPAKHLSRHP